MIESTYSLVSTAECATARAEESEADKPVSGGKGFHLPKFKLSLSASPPKPKPKMQPPTPRSGVCSLVFSRASPWDIYRDLTGSLSYFRSLLAAGVLEIPSVLHRINRLQRPPW